MSMLELRDVHTYYGNIHALKGLSLTVNKGEIVTLIGANGAGKTTTLRTIQGLIKPRQGAILLNDQDITKLPAHEVNWRGICQSPEGRLVFPRMTVLENLEMGAFSRSDRAGIERDLERVMTLFPRLRERTKQKAGTLSGGEQQMLAMARAMMGNPAVLLLDEPSMGLAPLLVETIFETIAELNKQGATILLVEQNARMALGIAKRGYVLQTGEIRLQGDADRLRDDEEVRKTYLGEH